MKCARNEGYIRDDGGDDDCAPSCKFCREEDFEDVVLLHFILHKLNKNREDIVKMIQEHRKNLQDEAVKLGTLR